MKNLKFITLIKTFSKKELKEFENYLKKLYAKKEREIQLLDFILQYRPSFTADDLIVEHALQHLKKQGFTRDIAINRCSSLYRIAEEFLLWKKLKDQPDSFERQKMLIEILKEKQPGNLYEKKIENVMNHYHKDDSNMWTHLRLVELGHMAYFSASNNKQTIRSNMLDQIMKNLDGWYVGAKLKYSCEQKFHATITKATDADISSDEKVMLGPNHTFQDNPLYNICRIILNTDDHDQDRMYEKLKELITENYHKDDKKDQAIYFGFLMNYIANRVKKEKGNEKLRYYTNEAAACVTFGLKNKLFLEDGYFPSVVFHNMIDICCNINKEDLAEQIIREYSNYIKEHEKEDTLKVARAIINFSKKKYDKIPTEIDLQTFTDRIMALRMRLIIIRTYYEKGERVPLYDYLQACAKAVRKSKDLGNMNRQSALNLIKYTTKLIKKPDLDKGSLSQEVQALENVFNKGWLLKKIEGHTS